LADYKSQAWECNCGATVATAAELYKADNCGEEERAGKGVWNATVQGIHIYLKKDSNVEEAFLVRFTVTNPVFSQQASVIKIESRGPYIAPRPMDSPSNDVKPIRVEENNFVIKKAGQSTPFPEAENHITVTLQSNTPFQEDDVIIIKGLVGAGSLPDVPIDGTSDDEDQARMQLLPHGSSNDYQLFKYSRQAGDTGTAA